MPGSRGALGSGCHMLDMRPSLLHGHLLMLVPLEWDFSPQGGQCRLGRGLWGRGCNLHPAAGAGARAAGAARGQGMRARPQSTLPTLAAWHGAHAGLRWLRSRQQSS